MIKIALRRSLLVLAFVLMLPASHLSAQTSDLGAILGAIEDPYPLRSADTSSPRDTFRTYLRDITTAVEAWQNDKPSADIDRLLLRAADTFDFSEITAVDRSTTIIIKMLLLKEILDRVALPPFGDIPNDEQVPQDGIVRWTVPNTKIEIAKSPRDPMPANFSLRKKRSPISMTITRWRRIFPTKRAQMSGCTTNTSRPLGRGFPEIFQTNCLAGRSSSCSAKGSGSGLLDFCCSSFQDS